MVNELVNIGERLRNPIDINLHKSYLTNDSYGRVNRRTVDVKNLIAWLRDNKKSKLDDWTMYGVASLFREAILEHLGEGFAIDLFGLGVLYITVKGAIDKAMPSEELAKHIRLDFTPSKDAQERVSNFAVKNLHFSDESLRSIFRVRAADSDEENVLFTGEVGVIEGKNVKLGGERSGVYFARISDEGEEAKRAEWIKVSRVFANYPSHVDFYLPDELAEARYRVIVESMLGLNGRAMKSSVQIKSGIVWVKAKKSVDNG